MSSDFPVAVSRGHLYFAPSEQGRLLSLVRAAPDGEGDGRRDAAGAAVAERDRRGARRFHLWDERRRHPADRSSRRRHASSRATCNVPDCRKVDALEAMPSAPHLRGLAVGDADLDAAGAARTIYAAATACGAVIKISQSGTITTILRTSGSWAPTAVAAAGGAVYVLEYDHSVPGAHLAAPGAQARRLGDGHRAGHYYAVRKIS